MSQAKSEITTIAELKERLRTFQEQDNFKQVMKNGLFNQTVPQSGKGKDGDTEENLKKFSTAMPFLVKKQAQRLTQNLSEYLDRHPHLTNEEIQEIDYYLNVTAQLIFNIFRRSTAREMRKPFFGEPQVVWTLKNSCTPLLQIYRNNFLFRSAKEKWFLAGMAFLGGAVGTVFGFFAGLLVGAIIGGGAGSIVPIFGNLVGAIVGGIAGAAGAAVSGAIIGSTTAGVISAVVSGLVSADAQLKLDPVKSNALDMVNFLQKLICADVDELAKLEKEEQALERDAQFLKIKKDLLAPSPNDQIRQAAFGLEALLPEGRPQPPLNQQSTVQRASVGGGSGTSVDPSFSSAPVTLPPLHTSSVFTTPPPINFAQQPQNRRLSSDDNPGLDSDEGPSPRLPSSVFTPPPRTSSTQGIFSMLAGNLSLGLGQKGGQ
jgi:hypothetical protein